MIFKAEQMEVVDGSGTPCGFRVEWTEARVFTERVLDWFGQGFFMLAFFALCAAAVAGLAGGASAFMPLAVVAAGLVGLGSAIIRTSARLPGKVNAIEIYEDGRIWSLCAGDWKTRIEDIRNIESEQLKQKKNEEDSPYTHGVRVVTRRGRVFRIATDIEPDDAITLAVLLSESVEAIRFPQMTASINGKEVAVW